MLKNNPNVNRVKRNESKRRVMENLLLRHRIIVMNGTLDGILNGILARGLNYNNARRAWIPFTHPIGPANVRRVSGYIVFIARQPNYGR